MQQTISLVDMVKTLPPDVENEVRSFVESLLSQRARRSHTKLKLQWRGALRDWRTRYTSVELQHQALEWWGHDVPH